MTHGFSRVSAVGIRANSWRSGICRIFLTSSRASVPHSGSLPKAVGGGTSPPRRARTIRLAISPTRRSAARNRAMASSWRAATKPRSAASSVTTLSIHQRA